MTLENKQSSNDCGTRELFVQKMVGPELFGEEKERAKQLLGELITRMENYPGHLSYLGEYTVMGRQGYEYISIFVHEIFNPKYSNKMFLLSAVRQGLLVGVRRSYCNLIAPTIFSIGNIEVFERSTGVGRAVEKVHMRLLQAVATVENRSVVYTIEDANLERIVELNETVKKMEAKSWSAEKLEEKRSYLKQIIKQRAAWEKLYGHEGELGFKRKNGKLKKEFVPGEIQEKDKGIFFQYGDEPNLCEYYRKCFLRLSC